jgi:glycerol-3-phosphate dehydrogenase subunit B
MEMLAMSQYHTLIIGAGLAGLTAGCRLAQAGHKVLLVSQGMGALLLSSGAIDVLGFHPPESLEPVANPLETLHDFFLQRPEHPYQVLGHEMIRAGLAGFLALVDGAGLAYQGTPSRNWRLPSTAGAVHPTCLAPTALAQGELSQAGRMLIVGFHELRDFYPGLISQNLNAQELGVHSAARVIDAPPPAAGKLNITPIELARAFEAPDFRRRLVAAIRDESRGYDRVGFPAVLGLERHAEVVADLQRGLDRRVFEISTLPPSVPGRRLFDALKAAFLKAGGRLILGSQVIDGEIQAGRVTHIRFQTVNRLKTVRADNFVLATGGIFGGGLQTDASGRVWEPIFGLPVAAEADRHRWFEPKFVVPTGQPIGYAGLVINKRLNPVDNHGIPVAENLYVAGASLAGSNWISGRTGNGVAVTTAAAIVSQVTGPAAN